MAYLGQGAEGNFTTTNAKDTFSGDGSETTFTLSQRGTENNVDVFVNNVRQEPGVAYNIEGNGTSLVFTAAPSTGTNNIYVVNRGPAELSASHPASQNLEAADGTFTGDLTVDTDTLYVDSTNNRVGIGTSSPTRNLHVNSGTSNVVARFESTDADAYVNFVSSGGEALVGSSGNDLVFYPAGTEKARIQSGGGISFNGDTAAANALDDYEEGTWTPVLKANNGTKTWTYNGQAGKYTKIGDTVTAWFNIQLSSNGSGTDGHAYVDGLPFASGVGFSVYTVAWKQLVETSDVGLMLRLSHANSYFWVLDGSSSYPDITYINTSSFTNDRRLRGQFTYKVS